MNKMRFTCRLTLLALAFVFAMPFLLNETASARKKCDFIKTGKIQPLWVSASHNYKLSGYYFGVGMSGYMKDSSKQMEKAKTKALANLASKISVQVSGKFVDTTKSRGKGRKIERTIEQVAEANVMQELKDIEEREKWLDQNGCNYWTLVAVSKDTIKEIESKITMQARIKFLKESIVEAEEATDVKKKHDKLLIAGALLAKVDFDYAPPEDPGEKYYKDKLDNMLKGTESHLQSLQEKMKIQVLQSGSGANEQEESAVIAYLMSKYPNSDRMLSPCSTTKDECTKGAKSQGIAKLALVSVSKKVSEQAMGYKGVLTAKIEIYNLKTDGSVELSVEDYAETIAWDKSKLSWDIAMKNIIAGKKFTALSKE